MEKGFYAFGTMNYIRIDSAMPVETQDLLLQNMQEKCKKLDDLLSAFKSESDIGKINANAGKAMVSIDAVTFRLLKYAISYAEASNGAFDPTIRPAVELWKIGKKEERVPEKNECQRIRKLVNYKAVRFDAVSQSVLLEHPGQALDLGGIAKGYAGDVIRNELIDNGVTSGILNFGGTILTIGKKTDGADWKIGIQNPLQERGAIIGSVVLNQDALVTSGVNERFFVKNGIRYHHLIDPYTCEPARTGVLSVTAAGDCAMGLDAITTALFILGVEKGIRFAREMGVEALYLCEDGNILATKEFAKGKYQIEMKKKYNNEERG